jgi:hypothetical protein
MQPLRMQIKSRLSFKHWIRRLPSLVVVDPGARCIWRGIVSISLHKHCRPASAPAIMLRCLVVANWFQWDPAAQAAEDLAAQAGAALAAQAGAAQAAEDLAAQAGAAPAAQAAAAQAPNGSRWESSSASTWN